MVYGAIGKFALKGAKKLGGKILKKKLGGSGAKKRRSRFSINKAIKRLIKAKIDGKIQKEKLKAFKGL